VDARGNAILVRQFRYATGGFLLEVPAGKLDHPGRARSLRPEGSRGRNGLPAGTARIARLIWTTPGFTDEKIWLYAAYDLIPTRSASGRRGAHRRGDAAGRSGADGDDGEIVDAKSVCALLRAASR
jgi:ADP-ribose pyrophosphatase